MVCSYVVSHQTPARLWEGPMEPTGWALAWKRGLPDGHAATRPTAAMQGAGRMPDTRKGILHGLTVWFSCFSMARRPWQHVLAHSAGHSPA